MAICKTAAFLRCKSQSPYHKLLNDEQEDEQSNKTMNISRKFLRLNIAINSTNNNARANLKTTTSTRTSRMMRMRKRWMRRVVLRKKRLRLSWLSPMEIFRRIRRAYIQAMLRESSDPGRFSFVVASHWSFPVIIPFSVAAAAAAAAAQ